MSLIHKQELSTLHEVHISNICPGIDLTCIHTDKFKTGVMSINLISALSRASAASSALLPRVLRRGSSDHPDMDSIASALDDLYGSNIEPIVRKKGELHCIGLHIDFPDEFYIPGTGNILEDTFSLAGEILLSPSMRGGLLKVDYIDSERKNLIDDIRASINDKRGYAIDRLLEEMCSEEAYSVSRLGSEKEAREITPDSLTAHYRSIIAESKVELLFCGSAEPSRVESTLRAALHNLLEHRNAMIPETNVILAPPEGSPKNITETLDVSQGKLAMGFRLGKDLKTTLDYPAVMVFNSIYGSGVTSKLFVNVREKLALCYYASSMIDKHKSIMIVSSGIDFQNRDVALDEILVQLDHVKKGQVSESELTSAKSSVTTSIKSAMDRPSGLMELYFDSSVSAQRYDPETLCDAVESVTLDSVVETSSDIELDTVYFLRN